MRLGGAGSEARVRLGSEARVRLGSEARVRLGSEARVRLGSEARVRLGSEASETGKAFRQSGFADAVIKNRHNWSLLCSYH